MKLEFVLSGVQVNERASVKLLGDRTFPPSNLASLWVEHRATVPQ